jgi:hypothetical protein
MCLLERDFRYISKNFAAVDNIQVYRSFLVVPALVLFSGFTSNNPIHPISVNSR